MNAGDGSHSVARHSITELVRSIPSDQLPHFAATLQRMVPHLEDVAMFRVDLILDANVVMSELLWMARKRQKPDARSGLVEVMDCKVVRAYAPHFMKREMKENIPEVAAKHGIDEGKLNELWAVYQKRIVFVAVGGPPKDGDWRDPKDVPYLKLQRRLNLPIVSQDADLAAMGGKVIRVQIFGTLRGYSRAAAIEFQMKASGALSIAIAASLIGGAISAVKRLPPALLCGGALISLLLLAHPTSRKKIIQIAEAVIEGGSHAIPAVVAALGPLFDAHANARDTAHQRMLEAKKELPA